MRRSAYLPCVLAVSALTAWPSLAWSQGPVAAGAAEPARSPDGRLLVTAAAATEPVRVDGVLDDPVWQRAVPVAGFLQSEPSEGQSATSPTQVRVAYDEGMLYIGAELHDEAPGGGVVTEIREDFTNGSQDTFEVILDTFADRQNGFIFMTNRAGARSDQQVTNEGRQTNSSWDAVWFVATQESAAGWVVEMAVPFTSLRFDPGAVEVWGINFSRRIRRNNEVDFWAPVPRAYALSRVSLAGNLGGLPALAPGRNLQVKPYLVGRAVRDASAGASFAATADVGLDLKYGVTPSLTLDATVNPDFAQVEADELTVNLTQFSTFFPEKREFFLENAGMFYVGDAPRNFRGSGGGGGRRGGGNTGLFGGTDLLLFHSRRIGLDAGAPVDIFGGGRLTGYAGGTELGLLTVQTRAVDDLPNTNYTVFRARRFNAAGSYLGGIVMSRQSTDRGSDYNRVFGVDANLRLNETDLNAFLVRTQTPGATGGQYALQTSINREGNFAHVKATYLNIGEGFQSDLSFVQRTGVQKYSLETGLRPRPAGLQRRGIREVHPHLTWNYYTDLSGRMISKRLHTGFSINFENGGDMEISVNPQYDEIDEPLELSPRAAPVPIGGYSWNEYQVRAGTDSSRPVSVSVRYEQGGLWSGTARTLNVTTAVRPSHQWLMSLGVNRVDADLEIPDGEFVAAVWTLRTNYSFNTNMYLDTLVQYDQDRQRFNANVRFNFIHHPLSDFFIVYNEQQFRDDPEAVPGRSVILKFTRMVAF